MSGWVAGAVVVAGIGGALASSEIESGAAKSAASTEAQATEQAAQLQYQEFQQQQQSLAPYLAAGKQALGVLQAGSAPGGFYNAPFTLAQFQQDPSQNYIKSQLNAATSASAAGAGLSGTPAAQEALQSNIAGLSAEEYQQAYSNFKAQQNQAYSQEAGLVNVGVGATNTAVNSSENYANNTGSLIVGGADARAAGTVASANAIGGAIGNIGQDVLSAYLYRSLKTPGTPSVDPSTFASQLGAQTDATVAATPALSADYFNPASIPYTPPVIPD